MEQFAIGANLESAAARGNQRKRLDALAELENFGRQTDGLRRVVSNDAVFDRDLGFHRQTPFRSETSDMIRSVKLRGHPERSEGSRKVTKRHANVRCVISQLLGGPLPSPRLGMTRGLFGGVAWPTKCSRSPLHPGCGISTSANPECFRGCQS